MAVLSIIFKAQDQVSKSMMQMDKQTGTLEKSFGKLAKTMASVFAGVQVARFVKDSTQAFIEFENGMNEVFTLLPDISGDAMNEMTTQVKKFSKEAGVLPEKTVPALYQALSAGVPEDNVFNFLETANKAAVGGVASLETAVDGLSTVVNSYGADVIDASKASDLMFTTVKLGKTNFEQLSQSLFNVLPSASAAGVQFEDVSAALAALTAQGVPTSVATTRVRASIDELSKAGTKTDKIFRQVAGQSFKEFIAGGGNLQEAFQMLEKEAERNNLGINDLFSSIEAGGAALALTGKGTEKFTEALEEMYNASGATDAAFGKMEQGLKRKIEKLKANFEVFKLEVGGRVAGALNIAFDVGSKLASFFSDRFGPAIDGIKKKFSQVGDSFKGFTELLRSGEGITDSFKKAFEGVFGKTATAVLTKFIGHFESIAKVYIDYFKGLIPIIKDFASNFFSGIEGIIPVVIDFAGNLLSVFSDLGSKIAPLMQNVVKGIGGAINNLIPVVTQVVTFVAQNILPILIDTFNFIAGTVVPSVVGAFAEWLPRVGSIVQNLWTIIQPILTLLVDSIQTVFPLIKDIIVIAIDTVSGVIGGLLTTLDGLIKFITGVFTGNWSQAWEGIRDIFSGIFGSLGALAKVPLNAVISIINHAIRGINKLSIKVPDWVPGLGGKGFSISVPEIPMLAKGSLSAPNTFIAGEEGPELITGARGSTVFPKSETSKILNALSSSNRAFDFAPPSHFSKKNKREEETESHGERTVNININGNGSIKVDGQFDKESILEFLIEHIKPILIEILQQEVFEEGELSYEF